MSDPLAGLRTAWWSFSLPGYRDHPAPTTYSPFSYDGLPPLEVPMDASWRWLEAQSPHEEWSLSGNLYADGSASDLSGLHSLAAQVPFPLPEHFATFINSPSLHRRIRSCTACILELSDFPVHTGSARDGLMIQFLVDQQGVLRWYLYVDAHGNDAVIVSGQAFGLTYTPEEVPRSQIDLFHEEVWLCARSFYEFIYRFWLENEIWFGLCQSREPLGELHRAYLGHYR